MYIDSHCHLLEMEKKGFSIPQVLDQLQVEGSPFILDVGIDLQGFNQRLRWREIYPRLYLSAGIHPNTPRANWGSNLKETLIGQGTNPSIKAIGETGLDLVRKDSPLEDQKELLEIHYQCSIQTQKPLILHIRKTEKEMMDWLHKKDFPFSGILHCFTGCLELATLALSKGFYISYAGNVSYKNAKALQDSLKFIPLERLLVETDAPYLSPQARRGLLNQPSQIWYTYDFIAQKLELHREELSRRVKENLKSLLKIEE